MASPINTTHEFEGGATVTGIPNSVNPTDAVPKQQMDAELSAKQNTLTNGNGVDITDGTLVVDLVQPATFSLVVSGMGNSVHNDTYQLIQTVGHLTGVGYSRTFNTGTQSGTAHYLFWNATTRTLIGKDTSTWYVYTLNSDSSSIQFESALNTNTLLNGMTFDWDGGSDYTSIASSSENYLLTEIKVPDRADSNVDYVTGEGSYLEFEAGKLKAVVVTDLTSVSTGQLVDGHSVKTYIDDAKAHAIVAGNNTFINSVAQLPGSPSTVQSAIESAASEIDTANTNITNNTNALIEVNQDVVDAVSVLGVSENDTTLGAFVNPMLDDNSDLKTVLESVATEIDSVDAELHSKLGVVESDVGMGTMVSPIFTDDGDAKALFEEAGSAIESLQVGAGAFWTAVDYHHHADSHTLPAGFGDGSTDVGTLVIDPTGSNLTVAELETGDRILVISDGTDTATGIYVVNADDSTQRSIDAQASADFTTNKTVNIVNGGSHAGATYAYVGDSDPTIGTDALPFEFKQGTNLGDGTVTEAKLESVLAAKVNNALVPYESAVVTIIANSTTDLVHGMKIYGKPWIIDTSNNEREFELDVHSTPGTLKITSQSSSDIDVVINFAAASL